LLHPRKHRLVVTGAAILWALVVMAGLGAVHSYELTPGQAAIRQSQWPQASHVQADPERANLVLLAHPRCPCTRASLDELARIAARCRDVVAVHIVFFRPGGAPRQWGLTDLRRRAEAIAGARVLDDLEGSEAARFGAATSGQALLYDRAGRLLFAGGITAARGQSGANAASNAVIAMLAGQSRSRDAAPVFGCPIRAIPTTIAEK
jgi:hypothetical protein